jgi:hypothetical protein
MADPREAVRIPDGPETTPDETAFIERAQFELDGAYDNSVVHHFDDLLAEADVLPSARLKSAYVGSVAFGEDGFAAEARGLIDTRYASKPYVEAILFRSLSQAIKRESLQGDPARKQRLEQVAQQLGSHRVRYALGYIGTYFFR